MKWKNKGHEFYNLGELIKNIKAVYLFGAGSNGKAAFDKFCRKIDILGFVDNDTKKQNTTFCGLKVFEPCDVKLDKREAIIIAVQPSMVGGIASQLTGLHFSENLNFFSSHIFFPLFSLYALNEICLPSVSFLPGTVCNLNCKTCLNFTPYIKKQEFRLLETLKDDLDLFFTKIDTIMLFHISGGEPFLYQNLPEMIEYVSVKYRSKIGRLEMTTNGTVVPSNELCKALKKHQTELIVDDYTDSVPQYTKKFSLLLRKLEDYDVLYRLQKVDSWVDLAPFKTDNSSWCSERLCKHFDACAVPWQEYRDGKLYLCNYAAYASVAGIQQIQPEEYFDFTIVNAANKYELIEFRLGYSDKGYTEFCKRCSGYANNPFRVKAAEQV